MEYRFNNNLENYFNHYDKIKNDKEEDMFATQSRSANESEEEIRRRQIISRIIMTTKRSFLERDSK